MSKQSSIEWLNRWFIDNQEATHEEGHEALKKAKAMHKEEIIETWYESKLLSDYISGNQYYNKTFEK